MDRIEKLINGVKVVSFDVFDTAIKRRFTNPKDVFADIESSMRKDGFYDARVQAERQARQNKITEDVTIEDIYNNIPKEYKDLKRIEFNVEQAACYQNDKIYKYYQYALAQGKKVIFTSDMYLPSNFIKLLLSRCGYKKFDKIYVSCEVGLTKTSGNLFKKILKDYEITPYEMLHIGDNPIADLKVPFGLGVRTLPVPVEKETDRLYADNKSIKLPDNPVQSIWYKLVAEHKSSGNYFQDLGYNIVGLCVLGMCQWIHEKVLEDKLTDIIFTARDGCMLNMIYPLIDKKTRLHYEYFTRAVCQTTQEDRLKDYWKHIDIRRHAGIGLFDLCTGEHSFFKTVNRIKDPKQDIEGLYFSVLKRYDWTKYRCMQGDDHLGHYIKAWDFFEYIISAPELPIESIDENFKPIHKKLDAGHTWELDKCNHLQQIVRGVAEFVHDFMSSPFYNVITVNDIIDIVNYFTDHMTVKDKDYLMELKCTRGGDYDKISSIFNRGLEGLRNKPNLTHNGKLNVLQAKTVRLGWYNYKNVLMSNNVPNLDIALECNAIRWEDRDKYKVDAVCLWGTFLSPETKRGIDYAYDKGLPVIVAENCFVRSVTAWSSTDNKYTRGYSFLLDTYPYFDADHENKVESDLNHYEFSKREINRARKCINFIVENRLTKYNHQKIGEVKLKLPFEEDLKKNLVIDQAYHDASISQGWGDDMTFTKMLEDASFGIRCCSIVKTHPESNLGQRSGYYSNMSSGGNIMIMRDSVNPIDLINAVDAVYVCSSQFGFESLMCGKETHIYGMPIYAGWGLTPYERKHPRRNRKRTIEEVFYALYIKNAIWISPKTGKVCEIETTLKELKELRDEWRKTNG